MLTPKQKHRPIITPTITETTKTPTQPTQIPPQPTIEIPEQIPVTKTEVTTETTKIPTQPTQIPQYSNQTTITKDSTYLWLFKPYEIKERIDYATNQIYFEIWQDSIFLGIDRVMSFTEYFNYTAFNNIFKRATEIGQKKQPQGEQAFDRMGLIPEISLPRVPLFGEGSKINISGSDKITFGGRQTFTSGFTQTATKPKLLPELKMEQALKVNLEGTIGERTKVLIDHDSEREQTGQNQISLKYAGTEDDIVQDLEFGDTRLVIPSTGYTGDLPSRKGLFGVSGKAKLGGVDLYAIASREQSQGETKEFRGQTRLVTDTIYDIDFLRRTFFSLGELANIRITDLRVYLNDGSVVSGETAIATVLPLLPQDTPPYRYDRDVGRYTLKVRGQDYIFHEESNVIEFTRNTPLSTTWGVAVSYIAGNDTVGGRRVLSSNDTVLVLKMIKPRSPDTLSWCWDYELKNIYSLGVKDVKIEDIKILRDESGTEIDAELESDGPKRGQTFLRILGLDPDNNGKVEWPEFDASNGYLVFPKPFPFDDESISVRERVIYRRDALSSNEGRKYYFAINYTTSKGSFNLGQFDIEDGSEKVYINNQLQKINDDYEINYITGELKMKKPLPTNADVRVTYEYRPLFSLAQKSLIGTRAEWKFSENGRIGSSLFYRQEATPDTRTTLGAEPFQRLIAESDISYNYQPDFINMILDKIPLLRTGTPSNFSFSSEGAISLPNPNTKGLSYLDDFEKTTITQDAIMRGLVWQFASVPASRDTNTFATERIFWYNPTTRIRKDSIFGPGIGEEGKETADYLRVRFIPNDTLSWAGIMSCVSQSGWNLQEIENLEVVLRTTQAFPRGKLHFTIATRIDEDAPRRTKGGVIVGYNNRADNEDRNGNGILDEALGEDVGLDTIVGSDANWIPSSLDDGNDDYNATSNPIGTEGNRRLDGEDLDQNGFSRNNDYFEYTISLSDSAFFTPLANSWKLLRIPLNDSFILREATKFKSEGIPKKEDIRDVRIWFSDFAGADTFDIYSLSFVGSRWRDATVIKLDTTSGLPIDSSEKVTVASVSQKTDPSYTSPFDLRRDPQTGQTEYEAALAMTYDSIRQNHRGIVKKVNFDKEDYREYLKIKIYVHNDINDPLFFFRFGGDSTNYYEFFGQMSDGNPVAGKENWFEFEINLDTMVFIKSLKGGLDTTVGRYRVVGIPSLAEIKCQALGIINNNSFPISGSIWFNDIRLTNPRDEAGYGFQSNLNLSLSDFISANVSFVYSDPNFRRFSEGRGVKTGGFGTNLGYAIRMALDRFIPASWGISIPISYRRSTSNTLPKYSSYFSDLKISKADAEKEKGVNSDEQWTLGNLSKAKSKYRILNYTIEGFSYSMGHRKSTSITLLNADTAVSDFGTLDYSIAPELSINLFDKDIYLFPNSIRAGLDITSSRSARYTRRHRDSTFTPIRTDTLRAADVSVDIEYSPLDNFNLGYSYGASRDLLVQGTGKVLGFNSGIETDNEENLNGEYEIEIVDIIKPRISYQASYTELHPKSQGVYGPLRNFDNNTTIELSTEFNLPEVFNKLGELGGENNLGQAFTSLSDVFQSIDFSYSKDRTQNFLSASSRPPWNFRFGFTDKFYYDTINFRAPQINRQNSEDLSASTGTTIKNISLSARFSKSLDKSLYTYDINANRTMAWPDLSLNIGNVEKLFFGLASGSSISTGYRLEQRLSGSMLKDTFRLEGQRKSITKNFSPLVSWQATWKSRLSTNFSTNYSQSKEEVFLTQGSQASENKQSGANFSLSYAFSAPNGIPLPFLKRVRLSSDLNVTLNVRYNKTLSLNRDYRGVESQTRNDRNLGTDIATSYRLSNSVESGLTTGYTIYDDVQRGRSTKNVDLNFWVLFKF